jgi:hypothetical protein
MNISEKAILAARSILADFGLPADNLDDERMAMLVELIIGSIFDATDLGWLRAGVAERRVRMVRGRDAAIETRARYDGRDQARAEDARIRVDAHMRTLARLDRILATLDRTPVAATDA